MLKGCVPWPPDLARQYVQAGLWEGITVAEMVERAARQLPDKVAVVHAEGRMTYAELVRSARRLANGILHLGLKPQDRVVVQLPNGIEFVCLYVALNYVGVIPVMALRAHRQSEILHFVRASGASAYFIADRVGTFDYRPMADEVVEGCPSLRKVVVVGEPGPGQTPFSALLTEECATDGNWPAAQPDPNEVSTMLLSGGTTSLSKLIPRTHNDYVLNARLCAKVAGFSPDTVFMAILPLGHNYNLAAPGLLGAFYVGATVVIGKGTDATEVFSTIEKERVTVVAAAVPLITTWLNSGIARTLNTTSLQVIQNGGARLAPALRARIRKELGCTPQEIYGTAEGLINMTRLDDADELLFESSGAPVSEWDEIKVIDLDDRTVPDGEPGELVTRGPYTIRGYYNAPEVDSAAFTNDGFYRMGDIVRKRGRYVYTEGRRKDLINRGGEKISCDEVENLIFGLGQVSQVSIVAMADAVFGEKACVCVVLQPGTKLTFDELIAHLRAKKIASFKLPERLEVLESFPTSPVGKILKRELREIVARRLATEKTVDVPLGNHRP